MLGMDISKIHNCQYGEQFSSVGVLPFFEYILMVPANRMGYTVYSASQLKIMQEAITLLIFAFFAVFHLGETIKWNTAVAFMLILAAVFFAFYDFSN